MEIIKRTPLILGGLAVVLPAAALVVSIVALLSTPASDHETHIVDRGEFTVGLVMDALELYEEEGLPATLEYYNSPDNVQGEWYVFIFDEDNKLIANANQDLLGMDLKGDLGVDSAGYRFGDVMLGATEQGLWVDYVFLNPATGNQEYTPPSLGLASQSLVGPSSPIALALPPQHVKRRTTPPLVRGHTA